MKARINLMHVNPGVIQAMFGLERQVRQAGFDHALLDLSACARRKSTVALIAWTCTARMRARTARPNSGSTASTRGARHHTDSARERAALE